MYSSINLEYLHLKMRIMWPLLVSFLNFKLWTSSLIGPTWRLVQLRGRSELWALAELNSGLKTLWRGFCWPEPVQVYTTNTHSHTPLLCFMSVGNFLPWHPHVITKKWRCVTSWKVLSFSSEMKAPHPEVRAPTLAQKHWQLFPLLWPLTADINVKNSSSLFWPRFLL